MAADVRVHVEHLVLEGIDPTDRYAVAQAIQAEIGRVLGEGGWMPRAGGAARVDAGSVQLHGDAQPGAIGAEVGARVGRAVLNTGTGER